MESSTVIAFRALVMLACLIVVPLAAIFGSQFPDVVKSVLIDHIWPPGEKAATPVSFSQGDAPPFAPGSPPNWHTDPAPSAAAPALSPSAAGPGYAPPPVRPLTSSPGAVEPTGARGPAGDGAVRHALHEAAGSPAAMPARSGAPGMLPPGAAAAPMAPPGQTDRFTYMECRLRDFGATYYLLERLVNGGERYRFFCQLPLAGNPGPTRNFEATDTDPLRAMARVVEQVEAWRSGRTP